jgi:hypothetical protein
MLGPLKEIDSMPSDTAEHVKQKEQVYRRRFLPALERFATVGDLWSIEAMEPSTIRPDHYAELLNLLAAPRKFNGAIESDWAQAALRLVSTKGVSPFHWEIAYPHVFLPSKHGFDVVLGNPPYDVLSEREIWPKYRSSEAIC